MQEECIICGAPLVYLEREELMECALCHKKESSRVKCENGHYVCDECHTEGLDRIIGECLRETSADPIRIIQRLMDMDFCHMHGPEHHVMVGAALLTAYKNAGGDVNLQDALIDMQSRGKRVPGGTCGMWGACGAGISSGIFLSIITGANPLSGKEWGLSNEMTSRALQRIGQVGGPRCCKRDSYLAILEAVGFVRERLGVEMETGKVTCRHFGQNNQCIGERCPFREKQPGHS